MANKAQEGQLHAKTAALLLFVQKPFFQKELRSSLRSQCCNISLCLWYLNKRTQTIKKTFMNGDCDTLSKDK